MVAQPQSQHDSVFVRMKATVQDLLNLPEDGYRYEMIGGVIIRMPPPQEEHGQISSLVNEVLAPYCRAQKMRSKLVADIGYLLVGADTVLAPDVSIMQQPRAPGETYATVAPLLAVEIASPSQSRPYLQDKAEAFLEAGTRMVWVIWPDTRTVDVWTGMNHVAHIQMRDTLDGAAILPGFTCPVADIFP